MKKIKYDIYYQFKGLPCLKEVHGYQLDDNTAIHHDPGMWIVDDLASGASIVRHKNKDDAINRYYEVLPRLEKFKDSDEYRRDFIIFHSTTTRLEELIEMDKRFDDVREVLINGGDRSEMES